MLLEDVSVVAGCTIKEDLQFHLWNNRSHFIKMGGYHVSLLLKYHSKLVHVSQTMICLCENNKTKLTTEI